MENLLTPYWLEIVIKITICMGIPLAIWAIYWAVYDLFKTMGD